MLFIIKVSNLILNGWILQLTGTLLCLSFQTLHANILTDCGTPSGVYDLMKPDDSFPRGLMPW